MNKQCRLWRFCLFFLSHKSWIFGQKKTKKKRKFSIILIQKVSKLNTKPTDVQNLVNGNGWTEVPNKLLKGGYSEKGKKSINAPLLIK